MVQDITTVPQWDALEARLLLAAEGPSWAHPDSPAGAEAGDRVSPREVFSTSPAPTKPRTPAPGPQVTWRIETVGGAYRLVVLGTNKADAVTVSRASGNTVIYVSGALAWTTDQVFSKISVYGFRGDDLLVSVSGAAETLYGGAGLDSFWADSGDTIADARKAEKAARSVHAVDRFYAAPDGAPGAPSLELAGGPIAGPATDYPYRDFSDRPLFTDGPEYDDVLQGDLGDCYFLAVLSSLAQQDPGLIRQMIAPLGDGTYAVRFFSDGQARYVRVDATLPVTRYWPAPVYASLTREGELWVALVEKAYARFRGGSYASLAGGSLAPAYTQATGLPAADTYTAARTDAQLAAQIRQALRAGHDLSVASTPAGSSAILGDHGYAVRSLQTLRGKTTVTVYNPWGVDGKSDDDDDDHHSADGLVTLTITQFRAIFPTLTISLA